MDELYQEFPATTAVISWHVNDEFTFEEGTVRANWFNVEGYPTVWFDGVLKTLGSVDPMLPVFLPIYEERIEIASNFKIEMEISQIGIDDYNVNSSIEILEGISTENHAMFVVLTETDLESTGNNVQTFVARKVYPDGMGLAVDFSTITTQAFNTVISLEEDNILENCEVVVFIQNMDTKEIYQGTSKMMTDITTGQENIQEVHIEIYPNPVSDRVNIQSNSEMEKLEVFNHLGQLTYQILTNSKILNLDVSGILSGLYFFKIQTEKGIIVKQVIIN